MHGILAVGSAAIPVGVAHGEASGWDRSLLDAVLPGNPGQADLAQAVRGRVLTVLRSCSGGRAAR